MAAIGESRRLTDIGHVVVCEEQHVLGLCHADVLDVFLAGTPVELAELLGKEGVAHIAAHGELFDLERLVGVRVNVLCDRLDRAAGRSGDFIGRRKSFFAPDAQHIDQDTVEVGVQDHIVAVVHGLCFARAAADKLIDGKACELLRGKVKGNIGFFHCLQDRALELWHITDIFTESIEVKFDYIIQQMFFVVLAVIDRMDALGRQGRHVAGMQQIRLPIALDNGSAFHHQYDLHIMMPVCPDGKVVLGCVKQKRFIGRVE